MYLTNSNSDIVQDSVHIDAVDNYYRLYYSNSAKYLLSMSFNRYTTMFDLTTNLQYTQTLPRANFGAFSLDDKYIAFVAKNNMTIIQSQTFKTMKIYTDGKGFGQISGSLDNNYFIYANNTQIYLMNASTFVVSKYTNSTDNCQPYYLQLHLPSKTLITCSQTGYLCQYSLPELALLQQNGNLNTTINEIDVLQHNVLVSQNDIKKRMFVFDLSSFSLKQDKTISLLNSSNIDLSKVVLSQGMHEYVLTFARGQSNQMLFIYNQTDFSLLRTLNFPYTLQAMKYSSYKNRLIVGIQDTNFQDSLRFMHIQFNCSELVLTNLQISSLTPVNQTQLTETCSCQNLSKYFSLQYLTCTAPPCNMSKLTSTNECPCNSTSFIWSKYHQSCELNCGQVNHSVSSQFFGQSPGVCYCLDPYFWSSSSYQCLTSQQLAAEAKAISDNKTNINNGSTNQTSQNNTTVPSQSNTTVPSQNNTVTPNQNNTVTPNQNHTIIPNKQQSSTSNAVLTAILIALFLAVIILAFLYYYKKLCFKKCDQQQEETHQQNNDKQGKEMSDRISEPEHYDEIRTDSDRNF